ncbi:hypothetical protein NUU61_004161 [Penicillium alfredii]|uniref:BRCT domain-containing protein n=1 Tax=Penicillium alfredii TaxID=1506179 RepID=A0A9W9KD32_9EURO|nr:uncharacterized protein NUU61_004161 [Penicillium alfredii]KAJ5101939.1 hypothetical protein NUU61_004161 [Penicillium alfredii]
MATMDASDKEYPLTGVVLCFTSILLEQRDAMSKSAEEMGATHRLDLTSDVTHLIVGDINTEKYHFVARERTDVLVMTPQWIEAVRNSWRQGEDTDIHALEEQYKLPAFSGLTICITGFSDCGLTELHGTIRNLADECTEVAFRAYMQKTVAENGADFRKDLTKSVTHLIARNTEGEKYKFATQWNIKTVTVKWFTDSLERGMILDESRYHPDVPPEQQGVGAWNRALPAISRKEKATAGDSSNPRPRKLRRIASTKLRDQNEGIWGDIVGTGFENGETKGSADDQQRPQGVENFKPVIQAAKSFASETTFSESAESRQPPTVPSKTAVGFLHGSYFFVHGFSSKQTGVLHQHLQFNGAQLVDSLSDFSSPRIPKTGHGLYIIVPYKTPKSEVPSTDDMAFECEVVTDMWLERCLDARSLVSPESHVASTPFPRFPIPGFSGMRVCSTGFARIDLLHLSKLVNLMGASYDEYLTPKASVLLCNDPQSASHDKLRHTSEWGVPAVSADWFWISIQTGQRKPFEPYVVRRPTSHRGSGVDKPTGGSATRKQPQDQINSGSANRSGTSSVEPSNSVKPEKQAPRSDKNRIMPIIGDGFSKEEDNNPPKPTIPESRSPSPANPSNPPATDELTAVRPSSSYSASAAPSALDTALSGLLQQARAAKSRQQTESVTTNDDGSNPPRRKRKPLMGRAPSHSSTRVLEPMGAPSRASSIDTLNDDGLGSALDSAHPTRDNSMSRTNSRNDQSLSSMLSGGKLDLLGERLPFPREHEHEDEENQEPPMTQLDYEDPDAAAMRAEFLRNAGKLAGKTAKPDEPGFLVGEVRELEDIGWGSGRRTRKHPINVDDE